ILPLMGSGSVAFESGEVAWLTSPGQEVAVTVGERGAIVQFLTLRPGDYPSTGMHLEVRRHQAAAQGAFLGQPQAPQAPMFGQQPQAALFGQPQAPQAPMFGQQAQAAPFGQPQAPQAPMFGQQPQAPFGQPQAPHAPQAPIFGQQPQAAPFGQPQTAPFAQPQAPQAPQAPMYGQQPQAAPGVKLHVACHIQNIGDQVAEDGQPAGLPGSKLRLEAVAMLAEGLDSDALEYAAISHDGRLTPWASAPQFCGTRGMGMPLLGFVARLKGQTEAKYDICYSGTFIQAGQMAEVRNGEFLQSVQPGDILESLRVRIVPKGAF
ncbi:hypothetical protein, partial [Fundidesulfovibrio agrisoli]|uniref:hypothetical protein n=1 Tax=Fundidesulfovibrio agrisoli TaxID=2922717 RepID=UPI002435ED3A